MNVKEYISSGIIESYVLGLASAGEQAEFERMCREYPEVRDARNAFEASLENFALANQTPPLAHLRQQVLAEAGALDEGRPSKEPAIAPVVGMAAPRWPRYVAAASVVLLVASLAANWYFYSQYKTYSSRYDTLLAGQSQLVKNNEAMQVKMSEYGQVMEMLRDTAMSVVKMGGHGVRTSPAPESMATVFWNTRSSDVYVMVNHLPASAADKQYELWAIVDGKPVAAGVFDVNSSSLLIKMSSIGRAQAFAVTLERRGGSPTPEGPMYVLGKI